MKILVVISHETSKALLCDGAVWDEQKGYYDIDGLLANQFWLPKSCVKEIDQFTAKVFIGYEPLRVLEVQSWLARNHGLKRYEWDGQIRKAEIPTLMIA